MHTSSMRFLLLVIGFSGAAATTTTRRRTISSVESPSPFSKPSFGVKTSSSLTPWSSSSSSSSSWDTAAALFGLRGGAQNSKDPADKNKIAGQCIGIDLGTTYSCVGVWNKAGNRVDILPNEQGHRITPSYVAFLADGTKLVGDAAKNQAPSNPLNTFFDVKRLIGRKFTDASVQRDKKLLPFKIEKDSREMPSLLCHSAKQRTANFPRE